MVSCQWLHLKVLWMTKNGRTKGWTLRISWNSSRDLTVYSRVPGSPKHQWLEILWFSGSWNFLTDFCWVVNAQQLLRRNGRKENSWTIQYLCSSITSKKPKPFAQTQKKEPGKRWSKKWPHISLKFVSPKNHWIGLNLYDAGVRVLKMTTSAGSGFLGSYGSASGSFWAEKKSPNISGSTKGGRSIVERWVAWIVCWEVREQIPTKVGPENPVISTVGWN